MTSALVAALHFIALGIGLGSVFMRGIYIRGLREDSSDEQFRRLFTADNFWGLAAILWIATGLLRTFGGLEKGAAFYLQNDMFILKMALFLAVIFLEIYPATTFVRWRMAKRASKPVSAMSSLRPLVAVNNLEILLVLLIPMVASLMARGIGFDF